MSIGEKARASGVAARMIRHYGTVDLIGASHRTGGGCRQQRLAEPPAPGH